MATSDLNKLRDMLKQRSYDKAVYKELKELVINALGVISLRDCLWERDYLKFLPCSQCGSPPPEHGHNIETDIEIPYLNYPLCDKCSGKNINYKYVAALYAIYAINKETENRWLRKMIWEKPAWTKM